MGRRADLGLRPLQQFGNRHIWIGRNRNEAGVRSVFQQTPHQISQQIFVFPHRRVGSACDTRFIDQKRAIKLFAHAMQPLKFKTAHPAGHLQNGRHRKSVVGGKLRINMRSFRQHFTRTGQIIQVSHRFSRKHWIIVQPALLRPLDLCIPIGTLDQSHHKASVQPPRQRSNIVNHRFGALLIGLDCKAEPLPPGEAFILGHSGDYVQ